MVAIPTVIAMVTVPTMAAMAAVAAMASMLPGRSRFELLVLFPYIGDQILAKSLCFVNHVRVRASDGKIHVLIAFAVSCGFKVTRPSALDLHSAASLLLNILHVRPAVADDLSSEIEAWNGLQVDGDLFNTPFASSEFITFNRLLLSATESTIIH